MVRGDTHQGGEYATDSITNKVLLSKYQLYLPDKKALQNALDKLLEN
jgi:hypothetical protein